MAHRSPEHWLTHQRNSGSDRAQYPANFKTRRWNYIAICSGAICGNADRIDNLLTVRQTLSNYGNRAGKRLTVAVGITQTTVANTIQTGKKTADCLGRTGTDRRCKYIY